jgi:hypothetical protein
MFPSCSVERCKNSPTEEEKKRGKKSGGDICEMKYIFMGCQTSDLFCL